MNSKQQGFTIIEVIVTMVVTTIFLVAFLQAYLVLESQRLLVGQRAKASDLAYTNLRKFTVRPNATDLPCTTDMDLSVINSSAVQGEPGKTYKAGKVLGDETNVPPAGSSRYGFMAENTSGTNGLGQNVKQSVKAYAPQGCGANYATTPLKIISTVTYGNEETVVHASLVN